MESQIRAVILQALYSLQILLVALAIFVTACALGVIVWRATLRWHFARSHGCEPIARSCNKDPILGIDIIWANIHAARTHKVFEASRMRHALYGHTFTSKQFLKRIATIEPENLKTVLASNFKDYGRGHRLGRLRPLLGAGIFTTDGEHWASSRALIRPSFTRDQVANLAQFEELIADLIALIPRDGMTTVDLQDLFLRYTIDSTTKFLFGESVGSLRKSSESELGLVYAFDYAQEAMAFRKMLGPLSRFYRDPKADRCNKICREFVRQFVEEAVHTVASEEYDEQREISAGRSESKDQIYIFSHELARRTSDKHRILDELMNVLLAGRDTTASLFSNLFFMLARHPEVWTKLRKESAALNGQQPTHEELRNLVYLKCCINESLRLHPVVPLNTHQALRDTVLPVGGGKNGTSPVFVAKGTQVTCNIYAMHRRHDIYGKDVDEFHPERWESGRLQPGWAYNPFNGGPRICLGQQYALTEVGYVTIRLAQEFERLESRDTAPWTESLTFAMRSQNGTKLCLFPAK